MFSSNDEVRIFGDNIIGRIIEAYDIGCKVEFTYNKIRQIGWFYNNELSTTEEPADKNLEYVEPSHWS